MNKKISVDDFVNAVDHADKKLINTIRHIIINTSPELIEGIKWNAPSYSFKDNDIITFNFKTFENISLIFHTGPKGKDTHFGNHLFNTYSEIIEWVADKRFVIKILDNNWIEKNNNMLKEIILKWIENARNNFEYDH